LTEKILQDVPVVCEYPDDSQAPVQNGSRWIGRAEEAVARTDG
jgi:hypothetical protein